VVDGGASRRAGGRVEQAARAGVSRATGTSFTARPTLSFSHIVRPPHDIYPGSPIRGVIDLGGTPTPIVEPVDEGDYGTSLGDVVWITRSDDPESPVTRIASHAAGCS
jgi:hypothetical protein